MQDSGELARPYAIAAFQQAREEGKLEEWSRMLALIGLIVRDRLMAGVIASPKVDRRALAGLILDVAGEHLSDTARNFVRVLVEYGRLSLMPAIVRIFNEARAREAGLSEVRVISAFELDADHVERIAVAMRERLKGEVDVSVEIDSTIIGGVIIRAGDMMIDASLRGRLTQLAQSLG